jgi:hypothetical protein
VCEKSRPHRDFFFLIALVSSVSFTFCCSGIGLGAAWSGWVLCEPMYCTLATRIFPPSPERKELMEFGMLWIFPAGKIRRLWSGANPRSWVPEASMPTTRPPKPLGIRSTDRPPRSQSLYRLSYLAHPVLLIFLFIVVFTWFKAGCSKCPSMKHFTT